MIPKNNTLWAFLDTIKYCVIRKKQQKQTKNMQVITKQKNDGGTYDTLVDNDGWELVLKTNGINELSFKDIYDNFSSPVPVTGSLDVSTAENAVYGAWMHAQNIQSIRISTDDFSNGVSTEHADFSLSAPPDKSLHALIVDKCPINGRVRLNEPSLTEWTNDHSATTNGIKHTSAVTALDELVFAAPHGWDVNTEVTYSKDRGLAQISALQDGNVYFVQAGSTPYHMKLSETAGGLPISISVGDSAAGNRLSRNDVSWNGSDVVGTVFADIDHFTLLGYVSSAASDRDLALMSFTDGSLKDMVNEAGFLTDGHFRGADQKNTIWSLWNDDSYQANSGPNYADPRVDTEGKAGFKTVLGDNPEYHPHAQTTFCIWVKSGGGAGGGGAGGGGSASGDPYVCPMLLQ